MGYNLENILNILSVDGIECDVVSGGEVGATGMGGNTAYAGTNPNGQACANTMLFWGGVGSGIGAIGSGVIGFFAGAAFGGYYAAQYASACQ